MAIGPTTANPREAFGFGAAAVTLGFIGLGLAFLAPFGVLLSAAGLICGIIGWVLAGPGRSAAFWWSLSGTLLSLIAVTVSLMLLNYGTFVYWWLGG